MRHALSISVIALAMLSGCADMDKETATTLKQADTAYREGRFDTAETLYRQVLTMEPDFGRVEGQLGILALWRNDLTEAERLLRSARKNGPWWARRWPVTCQIDHYIALAALRGGRVRDAAERLKQAAGPWPVGPFKTLKIHGEQLALFDDSDFYRIEGPERSEIPFVITDPLPVIRVSVNGSEPVSFLIDTGAEGIMLDREFAENVGANIVGEYAGEYAGGKAGVTGFGRIDRLQMGDISAINVPISTVDFKPTSQRVFDGMQVVGAVGTGFLMRFLATLDYPNARLILRRPAESESDLATELALDGTEHRFPFRLIETHLIFTEGSVNGRKPGMMLIDTGLAGAAFMTSKANYAAAGITLDWSKAGIGAGGGGEVKGVETEVAEIRLGQSKRSLVHRHLKGIATETDNSLFNGSLGFTVDGLISHQFFLDHALTFDFRNMQLIVQ